MKIVVLVLAPTVLAFVGLAAYGLPLPILAPLLLGGFTLSEFVATLRGLRWRARG